MTSPCPPRPCPPRTKPGSYERRRDLPGLIPMPAHELAQPSPAQAQAILHMLARALRAERRRGRAGHWAYDPAKHLALKRAYGEEWRQAACRPGAQM